MHIVRIRDGANGIWFWFGNAMPLPPEIFRSARRVPIEGTLSLALAPR